MYFLMAAWATNTEFRDDSVLENIHKWITTLIEQRKVYYDKSTKNKKLLKVYNLFMIINIRKVGIKDIF